MHFRVAGPRPGRRGRVPARRGARPPRRGGPRPHRGACGDGLAGAGPAAPAPPQPRGDVRAAGAPGALSGRPAAFFKEVSHERSWGNTVAQLTCRTPTYPHACGYVSVRFCLCSRVKFDFQVVFITTSTCSFFQRVIIIAQRWVPISRGAHLLKKRYEKLKKENNCIHNR